MAVGLEQLLEKAIACQQQGKLEEALALYEQLVGLYGEEAELRYKRANVLYGLGRWEAAVAGYNDVIALDSEHGKAFCNRGTTLERLGRKLEALESYDESLAINPADFLVYYNRGAVLKDLGRLSNALQSYDRAISLRPDYAEAFVNRGHVLQELQLHEQAIASYDRAIELKPIFVEAFQSRGSSLHALHRFEAAVESYDKAFTLDANAPYLRGMRRYAKMHICDWSGLSEDIDIFSAAIGRGQSVCTPYTLLALTDSSAQHRVAAETWTRDNFPATPTTPDLHKTGAERIRIGYFSPDFRIHPVGMLTAQLFEAHDRSRFETIAFALGPTTDDSLRTRLQFAFDRFFDVADRSDMEIATLAHQVGVDIAVDLAGFTEHSRSKIFALRAAPVQVNYLGYPGTMGSSYMDYLIADKIVIPESQQPFYSEQIVYLPHCYLPNDSTRRISESFGSRQQLGLPAKAFVFCCFNNVFKLNPPVFDCWMRILRRVEHSVLWLSQGNPTAAANLLNEADRHGIDSARIIFAKRISSQEAHLARLKVADLFLDTHPYNAHATAMDALWAGLPMLTYAGNSFAGRVGASLLHTIGMPELIAESPAHYEEMAVQLATDAPRLTAIRQKLVYRRDQTPALDGRVFARNLEAAYTRMYRQSLSTESHSS